MRQPHPLAMTIWILRRPFLVALAILVALVPRAFAGKLGLFEAFPFVDDRQLAVYEAEILQFVGSASVTAIQSALDNARDSSFQPLIVVPRSLEGSSSPQPGKRALLSIGIADFRNTS